MSNKFYIKLHGEGDAYDRQCWWGGKDWVDEPLQRMLFGTLSEAIRVNNAIEVLFGMAGHVEREPCPQRAVKPHLRFADVAWPQTVYALTREVDQQRQWVVGFDRHDETRARTHWGEQLAEAIVFASEGLALEFAKLQGLARYEVMTVEQQQQPIDMLLWCPACGRQHIDEATASWPNPPHRSHLCHNCGLVWRPADVPTNGVREIKTRGRADNLGQLGEVAEKISELETEVTRLKGLIADAADSLKRA